ncbi:hypothetical protein VNO77_04461 [Canavalia gladiata]|uniref:Uncharacterized protein n=1 Tax=Canavalia gladiata TaxID=3824 RepID=A0AAN9MWJ8_CANGL
MKQQLFRLVQLESLALDVQGLFLYLTSQFLQRPINAVEKQWSKISTLGFHLITVALGSYRVLFSQIQRERDRERQIIVQIMKSILSIKPLYCALKTTICYELLPSGKSWGNQSTLADIQFAMRSSSSSSSFGPFSFMNQCVLLTVMAYDSLKPPIFIFITYMWHHNPFISILSLDKFSVIHGRVERCIYPAPAGSVP